MNLSNTMNYSPVFGQKLAEFKPLLVYLFGLGFSFFSRHNTAAFLPPIAERELDRYIAVFFDCELAQMTSLATVARLLSSHLNHGLDRVSSASILTTWDVRRGNGVATSVRHRNPEERLRAGSWTTRSS